MLSKNAESNSPWCHTIVNQRSLRKLCLFMKPVICKNIDICLSVWNRKLKKYFQPIFLNFPPPHLVGKCLLGRFEGSAAITGCRETGHLLRSEPLSKWPPSHNQQVEQNCLEEIPWAVTAREQHRWCHIARVVRAHPLQGPFYPHQVALWKLQECWYLSCWWMLVKFPKSWCTYQRPPLPSHTKNEQVDRDYTPCGWCPWIQSCLHCQHFQRQRVG